MSKNTILKAIHNDEIAVKNIKPLGIMSKNTILKAIHNQDGINSHLAIVGNHE